MLDILAGGLLKSSTGTLKFEANALNVYQGSRLLRGLH